MIKSIKIDGVKLEELTCKKINEAMLNYRKDIAEGKDVQVTFEKDKERETVLY
jgi:hypothetical protein